MLPVSGQNQYSIKRLDVLSRILIMRCFAFQKLLYDVWIFFIQMIKRENDDHNHGDENHAEDEHGVNCGECSRRLL